MTKRLLIILFIMIIILNGCSASKNGKPSPTVSPTPAEVPAFTSTPVPVITPTPIVTQILISPKPTMNPTATPSVLASVTPVGNPSASDFQKAAQDILKHMTLEEKVGQMFFVRCKADLALEDIKTYYLGGYILFADDFKDKTKANVIDTIKSYQKASEIPMLIGVDEEGGIVNRVSKYTEFRLVPFKSPQDLYSLGGFDLIAGDTVEKARLLKSLGINVNLAPVCDVSTDPKDFIYPRSFGKNAEETSAYVETVINAMNSENIGSTLKHFPGYGNNVDTHTGIAIDNRSYDDFLKNDFLPFEAGIKAGAGSILVSHNIVTSIDKDYPASLSVKVHEIIRGNLGFQGVIMTDDLVMEAIKQYTDNQEAAVQAVLAGNDLLVATDYDEQIPAVIAAVKDGTISEAQIDEAVQRILVWKLSLGIIN